MSIFNWFQKKAAPKEPWFAPLAFDRGDWFQVFSVCLGKMMAVQTACGEQVVQGQDWNVDFSEGTIRFGERSYPLQFLGSESASSRTWLWGWENVNGFSGEILQLAQRTRETGAAWGLEPLTAAEFALDDTFNGHALSIAACGLAGRYAYYRCPHAGGAAFVAFSGAPEQVFAPVGQERFISLTMQCIQQFQVDHKIFVEGFLTWNRTPYAWNGPVLTAHFARDLEVRFEQAGGFWRIASIKSR